MSGRESERRSRSWRDRWNSPAAFRAMIFLFAIVLIVYGGIAIANALLPGKSIKDYELWYDTGQHILHGEQIYPRRNTKFPFMYPPPAALLLAPISALGRTGVVAMLVLVNAVAWLASILLSARLAAGEWRRQHLLVYLIPSALVSVYVWSCFHLGQPSVLLLALMLGAFVSLQQKRQTIAGFLIAFAAAIKAFPVVAIVYLLYRRFWIGAVSLVVSLIFFLILLPTPFRGFQQARYDLQRWASGMLFKYDHKGVAQRPGRSNSWKNQSIFGVANRLLRHVDADEQYGPHTPVYRNIAELSFGTVNKIILGAGLVLGLLYLAVMPRQTQRTRETDALEFALLLLLILMFTPLAFGYLFAWLLYPFAVIVWRLLAHPGRPLLLLTGLAVSLLALTIPLQRPAQIYGNVFFATLLLFVALALELWRLKNNSPLAPALERSSCEATAA